MTGRNPDGIEDSPLDCSDVAYCPQRATAS